MSRSIHETVRELRELKTLDVSSEEWRSSRRGTLNRRLERKRDIKALVVRERRGALRGHAPTPVHEIPVRATGGRGYFHHAASEEDVRAVLAALPPGVLDGLARVELCDRVESAEPPDEDEDALADDEADPFTGTRGSERWPGVYAGPILGTYTTRDATIRIGAFRYDLANPLREVWEVLLKLDALATLVHEVAHHHDDTARVARGRWRGGCGTVAEIYAEARTHAWTLGVVVPYLERRYPNEVRCTVEWVRHHGGVRLSLTALAGDPRHTTRRGGINYNGIFSIQSVLDELFRDAADGRDLREQRLTFARYLHHREMYAAALTAIDCVLLEHPEDAEALTLRADIYVHQGRHATALDIARRVVAADDGQLRAWGVVADACEGLGWWDEVEAAVTRIIDDPAETGWRRGGALLQRASARIETGDSAGARADLDAALATGFSHVRRRAQPLLAKLAESEGRSH